MKLQEFLPIVWVTGRPVDCAAILGRSAIHGNLIKRQYESAYIDPRYAIPNAVAGNSYPYAYPVYSYSNVGPIYGSSQAYSDYSYANTNPMYLNVPLNPGYPYTNINPQYSAAGANPGYSNTNVNPGGYANDNGKLGYQIRIRAQAMQACRHRCQPRT
jgi:hypothetical protein